MVFPRTEDLSWACPSAVLDGHGLAKADCSRGKEDEIHVVIPFLYHLANFPKLINIGWGVSVSKPKFTSDGVKLVFRHKLPEVIGAWICLLIKGGDTPKFSLFHPEQMDIKIHRPKYRSRSRSVKGAIPTSFKGLDVDGRRTIIKHLRGRQCRNMSM